jgi:hypothetical protein
LAHLSTSLGNADDQMLDWMHAFKEDFKGGQGKEVVTYFNDQKAEAVELNGLYEGG